MTPFANEADSMQIGELTMENGTDRIALYGNLDLTRDKDGLKNARLLKTLLDQIVKTLESDKNLPDKIAPPKKPEQVKNPFQ
jgi:hypothetical protein